MQCSYPKCSSSKAAKKVCSRCKTATYCCRDCQKKHFKVHKKVCKPPPRPEANVLATKSSFDPKDRSLLLGIKQAEAELQEAMKQVAEARAAAEKIQQEVAAKQAKYDQVKKQEDKAAASMEKAMSSLRTGGLDGNGMGLEKTEETDEPAFQVLVTGGMPVCSNILKRGFFLGFLPD